MKNHPKTRDFSLLWKIVNKNPLQNNVQSFLRVTVTPLPLPPPPFTQISRFRSMQRLSSNNSENTNCHWLVPITAILGFWKYSILRKLLPRTIFFSQSPRFQFSCPILDGLTVTFNARHFFMRKQFMCVDCYTGRLIFFNIIRHNRAIRRILVASQAEVRKDDCVPEVVAYEWNLIVINHWREIL